MAISNPAETKRSSRDTLLIFSACAFPIHVWAIFNLLDEIPAWILRLSLSELAAVIAYTLLFALLESLLITGLLLLVGFILPKRWVQGKIGALGSAFILLNSVWAILIQLNYETIRLWSTTQTLVWAALLLGSNLFLGMLIFRSTRLVGWIRTGVERLAVLSFLYVLVDVLGFFVILYRNLFQL